MTDSGRGLARARIVARVVGGVVGASMIAVALLADRLGLDHSPTFGVGETLLLVAGVVVVAVAILGHRTPAARRGVAVFLLDAVLLLLAVEFCLVAVSTLTNVSFRSTESGLVDRLSDFYLDLPYYRAQPWAETYWRENAEAGARHYRPFVVWRRAPYDGETVTIDADGFRVVPGARCDAPDAFRVDALGGSTMWGWGAPDEATIPAFLQRGLEERLDRPVCVRNLGETAYVSTQELVQWTIARRDDHVAGRPPADLVLFYDGINDTLAAHQAGRAGAHQNLAQVEGRLEAPRRPLAAALGRLRVVGLARNLLPAPAPPRPANPPASPEALAAPLARDVVATWLGVVETASSQAPGRTIFFWQPMLGTGDKPLLPEETALVAGALDWAQDPNPAPLDFFRRVWDEAARIDDPRVVDLRDAFDGVAEPVWIDPWGHVTPIGNRLVAERMLEAIEARLELGEPDAVVEATETTP